MRIALTCDNEPPSFNGTFDDLPLPVAFACHKTHVGLIKHSRSGLHVHTIWPRSAHTQNELVHVRPCCDEGLDLLDVRGRDRLLVWPEDVGRARSECDANHEQNQTVHGPNENKLSHRPDGGALLRLKVNQLRST
jgi:hypothetical protein